MEKPLWELEPPSKKFEAAGLQCLILRDPELLNLCGFVRVPEGFALTGDDLLELEVHGSVNHYGKLEREPADPDALYVGFDCRHFGDLIPAMQSYGYREGVYRDMVYVQAECQRLAHQIHALLQISETLTCQKQNLDQS